MKKPKETSMNQNSCWFLAWFMSTEDRTLQPVVSFPDVRDYAAVQDAITFAVRSHKAPPKLMASSPAPPHLAKAFSYKHLIVTVIMVLYL
jgi:hypothetical protein